MVDVKKEFERWQKAWRAVRFYRRCVCPGQLCFDIGANRGSRAVIFTFLGARTIAVEPNETLTGTLRRFPRVTVVNQAISDKRGRQTMLFNRNDQISSLNPEWRKNWPEFSDWFERVVECVTLDQLIAQYGLPDFCKIDVEGYEASVLAGLTRPIPLLSFEATPGYESTTETCLASLSKLGDYEYNFAVGDDFQWLCPEWVTAKMVASLVATQAGDIYARLKKH